MPENNSSFYTLIINITPEALANMALKVRKRVISATTKEQPYYESATSDIQNGLFKAIAKAQARIALSTHEAVKAAIDQVRGAADTSEVESKQAIAKARFNELFTRNGSYQAFIDLLDEADPKQKILKQWANSGNREAQPTGLSFQEALDILFAAIVKKYNISQEKAEQFVFSFLQDEGGVLNSLELFVRELIQPAGDGRLCVSLPVKSGSLKAITKNNNSIDGAIALDLNIKYLKESSYKEETTHIGKIEANIAVATDTESNTYNAQIRSYKVELKFDLNDQAIKSLLEENVHANLKASGVTDLPTPKAGDITTVNITKIDFSRANCNQATGKNEINLQVKAKISNTKTENKTNAVVTSSTALSINSNRFFPPARKIAPIGALILGTVATLALPLMSSFLALIAVAVAAAAVVTFVGLTAKRNSPTEQPIVPRISSPG